MKTIHYLLLPAFAAISLGAMAQEKTPSDGKVGKAVNKAGNKTAHVAVKATSAIVDKKYDGKTGPDGQTIYINNKSEYYYVNGKGKKIFVTAAQLKDKNK
ncbi:MAG TPA: hypothetical protein VL307_08820 [Chitinophagaceae bacterium]|jgi:hypothetical protein|nr:hypothetical protein [Chitinophagaceae bacterium]